MILNDNVAEAEYLMPGITRVKQDYNTLVYLLAELTKRYENWNIPTNNEPMRKAYMNLSLMKDSYMDMRNFCMPSCDMIKLADKVLDNLVSAESYFILERDK